MRESVYDYDLDESLVSANMVENSYCRILLADTTKLDQKIILYDM